MAIIPNSPSLARYAGYQALGFTALVVLTVPTLVYRSFRHLRPAWRPYPTWSYRRDMAVAFGRLYLACTTYFCLPRPPAEKAWQEDALIRKQVGEGTQVLTVEVPPIAGEWLVGIATSGRGSVYPAAVPCFWTFHPELNIAQGDERARDGERVVLYVAGGSVHFSWYL